MNLFYQPGIPEGIFFLDQDESRHCVKVLRKIPGDQIRVTDGKGSFYDATIIKANPAQCEFSILKTTPVARASWSIHVAIAPTKNADRIEWFVEKAVEFGVDEITLLQCKNSERTYKKTDRLKKVAISAMKQSLKPWLPEISALRDVNDIIAEAGTLNKYIAHVDSDNPIHLQQVAPRGQTYLVLIGPEGDFTDEEVARAIDNGFTKVSLGPSRLRTETAGVAACHILNLINN